MTRISMLFLALIAVASLSLVACGGSEPAGIAEDATDDGRKALFYKSGMDPSFISQRPGKDSMGMDLVPVYEGDPAANLDVIEINGATIQRMGVRVAPVKRANLTRLIRAVGRVAFDEARIANVNMKFDGWIERLYVNETGQEVKAGDRLFAVYSPELLASQEEYLQLRAGVAAGPHTAHLVRAARQRLLQFDVPESFIRSIEKSGKASRRVVVRSPKGGFVIHKTALEGSFVKKGASLYTVADLDALWVEADVFAFDAPWVVAGQKATVEFDYLPGQIQEAEVDYVYPTLNERSRTLQIRIVLPNPAVALKPGMFATVRIHTQPVGETLVVPTEAVIHSGERNVSFVHLGEGRFEPRELRLGVRGDEEYEVLDGLSEGEMVVTSGQFLIDSESRLKEAVKKMLGSNLSLGGEESAPAPGDGSEATESPTPMDGMDGHGAEGEAHDAQ